MCDTEEKVDDELRFAIVQILIYFDPSDDMDVIKCLMKCLFNLLTL